MPLVLFLWTSSDESWQICMRSILNPKDKEQLRPPLLMIKYSGPPSSPFLPQQMGLQIEARPAIYLQARRDLILISFDCPFVCLSRRTPVSCVHTFLQTQEFSFISPHLPENDTVLPLSASCYLPMYLHQIVLLPYQTSTVLVCLLVCSVEIMNTLQHIQVLSTCKCVEEKRECQKKK